MSIDPKLTHAVVAGIGQVAMGPEWDLPGAAVHALEFVEWLRASGVPAANIHLFLSSQEHAAYQTRIDAAGVAARAASRSSFEDFLDKELAQLSGELLYFYWSGHGNIGDRGNRVLFFEEWEEGLHNRHLDLTNTLERLRTAPYGTQFPEQHVFVDACANEFPFDQRLGENKAALQGIVPVRQIFFLAADSGQQARAGEFSKALLQALAGVRAAAPEWPPDPDHVIDRVLPQFENATQRPVAVEWRMKSGRENHSFGDLPSSKFVNAVEVDTGMPLRYLRKLSATLSEYEVFDDRAARDKLRNSLAKRAGRAAPARSRRMRDEDLLEIVATAFYWNVETHLLEEVEAIQSAAPDFKFQLQRTALLRRVRKAIREMLAAGFSMEKVRGVYRTTISSLSSEPGRDNARTLAEMLDELCVPLTLDEQFSSLYEFLLRLSVLCPACAPALRALIEPARLQALEGMLAREQRFTLRIAVYEENGEPQQLTAQLFETATGSLKERWPDVQPGGADRWAQVEAEVRSVVRKARDLVQQRYQKKDPSALEIEFLLPLRFLLQPCEEIRIPSLLKERPIGHMHPVIVRWLERRLMPWETNQNLWMDQTAAYAAYRKQKAKVSWVDTCGVEAPAGTPGISALRFCPGDTNALVDLLLSGKPFLAWVRCEPAKGWQDFSGDLDQWAGQYALEEVPLRLLAARSAHPPAAFAQKLTLFWDDPDRDFEWKSTDVGIA